MQYLHVKPHLLKSMRHIEVANEVILLSIFYHIMMFSDYLHDDVTAYHLGDSLAGHIGLLVVINVAFVGVTAISEQRRQRTRCGAR